MEITREQLAKARGAAINAYESAEAYSFNVSLQARSGNESSPRKIVDLIQNETSQLVRVIKRLDESLTASVLRFIEEHAAAKLPEFMWRGGTYATAHEGARRALDVALHTTELQLPYQEQFDWPFEGLNFDIAQKVCQAHWELNPQKYLEPIARVKREWALAVGLAIADPKDPGVQRNEMLGRQEMAIGLLSKHPEWTDQQIADELTKHSRISTSKGTVNRWLKPLREIYEESLRKGSHSSVIRPKDV